MQGNNVQTTGPVPYQGSQPSMPMQTQGQAQAQAQAPAPVQLQYQVPLQPYSQSAQKKTDGYAITALVTGLAGLFLFGIILGPIAVVFGVLAKKRIKESSGTLAGEGMATAGFILGIVDAAWFFVWLGLVF